MGPKKADNANKGNKTSLGNNLNSNIPIGGLPTEHENQLCIGKFATDLEVCCRELSPAYPVVISVVIRGRTSFSSSSSSQILPLTVVQNQQPLPPQPPRSRSHSRTSGTPSVNALIPEEQSPITGKKTSRLRKSSINSQAGVVIAITDADMESQSLNHTGQETLKPLSSLYKTFQIIDDNKFFRPKLLVDLVNTESETIDQITALYMRAWRLDQHFINILKKVLPLQEQLHTLNLCFVGLHEQTINGLVDLCQIIKNLKNISLDGNPSGGKYFHRLIEKDDSKITNLSLRFCDISDEGIKILANVLGNMWTQNWKLLELNLSGNQIGDIGAISLATALRYNRTLISLNLSSNLITDKGAHHLALVIRRIVLTDEEIIRRRYLLSQQYAEAHPDEWKNIINSPTPSILSTKSKSSRADWKRVLDPNKRKSSSSKFAQIVVDKRNRSESDESRPSSRNRNDSGRLSALNTSSNNANAARRTPTNTNNKETDQIRSSGTARTKKTATATSTTSKKNISIVKEEDEDVSKKTHLISLSSAGKSISLQDQQAEHMNPLIEINQADLHSGQIWLNGNFVLLNLNLSRNNLTINSVKEFLLSVQQQSALIDLNENLNPTMSSSSSSTNSLLDFSGICRIELKGMNEISTNSIEYQSLEKCLQEKNPLIRFQQYREREAKEILELQSISTSQQPQSTLSDKISNTNERFRSGSSMKMTAQRPTSRLKE